METWIGLLLASLTFTVGVGMGYAFRVRTGPCRTDPSESVFRSALALYSNTCDKHIKESAAVREFAHEIVTELLSHNTKYANQVLVGSDNALERMRVERDDPKPTAPRPRVDPAFFEPTPPDVNIPDLSGRPDQHD